MLSIFSIVGLLLAVAFRLIVRPRQISLGNVSDGWRAEHSVDTGKDGSKW
jgi:hypothetical protein